jgi:TPR repeat protein
MADQRTPHGRELLPIIDLAARGNSMAREFIDNLNRTVMETTDGQYLRGVMHAAGAEGVAEDPILAYAWLSQAANGGHAEAASLHEAMSKHLTREQIVMAEAIAPSVTAIADSSTTGYELAIMVLAEEMARKHESPETYFVLGYMFLYGPDAVIEGNRATLFGCSVQRDLTRAYAWLSLSAAHGHLSAGKSKDRVLELLTPEQVNLARNYFALLENLHPPRD